MERRWAFLGRATTSRRNYKVGWCSTKNSATTQNSSSQLLSTLQPPPFPVSMYRHRSTLTYRGRHQVFSSSLNTPAGLPSQDSSRFYYAIHHHLRRSTFCLQECLPTQCPVQGNILDRHSAGKCLLLLLNCLSNARRAAATISSVWSSCVLRPSHLLPTALPGCNTWCSSVPRDIGSMETSFLI